MNGTITMKRWLATISLVILGGGMSACADGTSWKEEVLLHDGKKLVIERSVVRKGRHEIGQKPPIGEERLDFRHPVTGERIRWKDEYGDDVGMSNFGLLMLEIDPATAYIVAEPRGCLSYNKWGRPNPPYVVFKYLSGDWKRIPLQDLPAKFRTPNLILSSPDEKAKQAGTDLITAEMVKRINTPQAAWLQQPQYKTILREAKKPGSPGVDCPDLGSSRYTSPRGWAEPYVPRYNTIAIPPSDSVGSGKSVK